MYSHVIIFVGQNQLIRATSCGSTLFRVVPSLMILGNVFMNCCFNRFSFSLFTVRGVHQLANIFIF